jgi:hypothetical protein
MLKLTHEGKTLTPKEWSKETGISLPTIFSRKARGWTDARALSQAVSTQDNKITKNDAELWLNDKPIGLVPASLKHTVIGTGTAKAGQFIRRYFPKDFDRWFNEEYKPAKLKELSDS